MTPTCQPALMTGPYDWDPAAVPLAEYQARLARVRGLVGDADLLVVGDRWGFEALAWLTGFTPKLGPALAWFPSDGSPRLWFSGGPGMAGSAKLLTWIGEVSAFGSPARDLAPLAGRRVVLWGEAVVSASLYDDMAAMVGGLVAVDDVLDPLRLAVSAGERVLLGRAAAIVADVAALLRDEWRDGALLGAAVVAAERLGYGMEAQDVRVLVSRRAGGVPLPIDDLVGSGVVFPASVLVAVRCGLWVESVFTFD